MAHGAHDLCGMQLVRALDMMDGDIDMTIDGDVFRPSALLDSRMQEEFGGGALDAAGFPVGDLGGHSSEEEPFVDIEQMLWADSDEYLLGGDGSSMQQQLMLAQLNANTRHQQLPPKYFTGVQCSPQKRRVHRRTFGERCRPFGFEGAATTRSMDPATTTSSVKLSIPSNSSLSSTANNRQEEEVYIKCEDQAMDDVQEFVYIKQEVVCSPQRSATESKAQLYQTPVRSTAPSSPTMSSEPSDLVMKTPLPMVHVSSQQFSPADAMGKTMQNKEVVPKSESLDWTSVPESHLKQLPSSLVFGQPTGAAASLPPRYFSGSKDSPQKRRVVSSTFGSFARSFSFTSSND